MKMKNSLHSNIFRALVFILMPVLYSACESVLFIELEESDKLIVLNGAISSDSLVSVQVSRTRHILDNAPVEPLENAKVSLYQNGTLLQELAYTENGSFVSADFIPSIGYDYSIEVENAGYESVTASSEIPALVPIELFDTVSIHKEDGDPYSYISYDDVLQFDLTLQDPAGVENFYLLSAEADRSYTEYRDTTIQVWDSGFYNNQWNYFLTKVDITLTDIHRFKEYPYIRTEDIVVEGITSHGVLFTDNLFDGKSYSFKGEFYHDQLRAADSAVVDMRLHSISESYYKYLKSRQKHYSTKGDYLAVPVIVYSNVDGGTGFFGGYSSDVHTFTTFIPEYDDYWYRY